MVPRAAQGSLGQHSQPQSGCFLSRLYGQFISASRPGKPLSFFILGIVFMTPGTLCCPVIAVFTSSFDRRLNRSSHAARQLTRSRAILYILLGLELATAKPNPDCFRELQAASAGEVDTIFKMYIDIADSIVTISVNVHLHLVEI